MIGNWPFLWRREWPVRIAGHVFLAFFLPSTSLGCIGPLAAKMGLDLGRQVGRTVGSVYAWGAVGSIVGTFLTGFVLIARIGSLNVLAGVAAFLAVVAVLFAARSVLPYAWACIVLALVGLTWAPRPWASELETRLGLTWESFENLLHAEESQYAYIQVAEEEDPPSLRSLSLDHLIHAYVVMDDPNDLQYDYEQLYAFLTGPAIRGKPRPSALFLGGGGFVYPRYFLSRWPGKIGRAHV